MVAPTSYKGVEGGVVQQQKGKLVKCQTCFGETDYIAYPMETITRNGLSAEDRFQVQTKQGNLLLEV